MMYNEENNTLDSFCIIFNFNTFIFKFYCQLKAKVNLNFIFRWTFLPTTARVHYTDQTANAV